MRALLILATLAAGAAPARAQSAPRTQAYEAAKIRPAPTRPADPWAAVKDDQPVNVTEKYYFANGNAADCSAAHDHCLPAWAWLVESGAAKEKNPAWRSANMHRIVDGDFDEGQFISMYREPIDGVAYRTVPATKKNLAKGTLVAVLPYPAKAPTSEADALGSYWYLGYVDAIDWDSGKLTIVDHEDPVWLSVVRVPVLRWTKGGKVEIVGKRASDELAVAIKDVIPPRKDEAKIADPWASLGKDGMPIETTDTRRLESTASFPCDAAHDHCLRPWVWFTEHGLDPVPVMFKNGKMRLVTDVDDLGDLTSTKMAYKTTPATENNLKEGALVFFTWSKIGHEREAVNTDWMSGRVTVVQPEAGLFKVKGEDKYYKIANCRVAVVQWFPGDKAEKVE